MAISQFKRELIIKASMEDVWNFVSSPANLKKITPPDMGFDIVSGNGSEEMRQGMMITYKVKPLWGISTTWVTEITQVKPFEYFVDEQRVGPYTMWHHEHIFEEVEEGIRMVDSVSYLPPMGFIGEMANKLVIRNRLQNIFDYRQKAFEAHFKSGLTTQQ